MAANGTPLPEYVRREFEDYLRCGCLEYGFPRVRCESCHAEHLVAFSWSLLRIPAPAAFVIPFTSQARGFCPSCGARRMAESAALLVDDGVYVDDNAGSAARFRWVKAPTSAELTQLSHTLAHRVSRFLERQGLLVRDDESAYLTTDTGGDDPMDTLIGHSIT